MTASTDTRGVRDAPLLRRVLLADAGFSALSGIALAAGCVPIDRLLGLGSPLVLAAIGLGLLPYAWVLLREGRRPEPDRREVLTAALLDLAWVAAGLVTLAALAERLTAIGMAAIAGTSVVVLGFAALKTVGLSRKRRTATALR